MTDEGERRPALRVVAVNDIKDLDRNAAMRQLEGALRELAANIIRSVRGAGKSNQIPDQCMDVVNAVHRYHEQAGVWPSSWEIGEALTVQRDLSPYSDRDDWEREVAYEVIMRGSLQMAASRLAGQLVQERRGEAQMVDAVTGLIQLRDEALKRRMDAEKEHRRAASGKSKEPGKGKSKGPIRL